MLEICIFLRFVDSGDLQILEICRFLRSADSVDLQILEIYIFLRFCGLYIFAYSVDFVDSGGFADSEEFA